MKKSLLLPVFTLLCLFALSMMIGSDPARNVLRVGDGKIITFSKMIDDVKKADIVFVGEMHDNARNHQGQLDVISALDESGRPIAVGLEMFRTDSQNALDRWVKGELSVEQFMPVYYSNWTMPWSLYSEIFAYTRERGIPMIGLNISDQIARKIAREGFASLSEGEKEQLPPGISCNVDPTYMDFIRRAYAGHTMHGSDFVNFCEAQMVWDKSMGWHLTEYLKENPGRTAVVLAGIGHAWKHGISEQVKVLNPELTYRSVLPLVPDQIDKQTVTASDADYVMLD